MFQTIHHVAIICSNYAKSKRFYTEVLGLQIISETYREDRQSYKLDLAIGNQQHIELFSFPHTPKRVSQPEACGLRHLAFKVNNLTACINYLNKHGITTEKIRVDELTGKRFTFFADPDDLPIEIYEEVE